MGEYFGNWLKERRAKADLSATKLSLRAQMPLSTLSAIERGRRSPSEANLRALAGIPELEITYEELVEISAEDKAATHKQKRGLFSHIDFEKPKREFYELWEKRSALLAQPESPERDQQLRRLEGPLRSLAEEAGIGGGHVDPIQHEWLDWFGRLPYDVRQVLLKLTPEDVVRLLKQ